jgi:hypothetical protein
MKFFITAAALALAGTAISGDTATVEPDDIDTTRIDIGRLGVINDHTREIWLKMRPDRASHVLDDPVQLNSSLRQIVWDYNALREELCNDRFLVERSCGAPYVPKWVYEAQKDVPTAKVLSARQEELADRIIPLWDAVCERLRKVMGDDIQRYCSVE